MAAEPIRTVPAMEQHGCQPWIAPGPGAYWKNGGNSNGAASSLGTLDAFPVSFFAQGASNVFLTSDGITTTLGSLARVAAVNIQSNSHPINITSNSGSIGIVITDGPGVIEINNTGNDSDPIQIFAGTTLELSGDGIALATDNGVVIAAVIGTPDPSATFDIQSTVGGFLLPRMTTVQRNEINFGHSANALQLWNTDTNQVEQNVGTTIAPQWATGTVQYGGPIGPLVGGVITVTGVNLTAKSVIDVTVGSPVPGAGNLTVRYGVLEADRTNGAEGAGQFKISALNSAGTLQALDTSNNIRWTISGQ